MTWHKKDTEATSFNFKGTFNKNAPRGPPTRARRSNSINFREAEDILDDPRSSRFHKKRSISKTNLPAALSLRQGDANFSLESSRQGSKSTDGPESTEELVNADNLRDGEHLLGLSDSVRTSIKAIRARDAFGLEADRTFGPEADKLSAFLNAGLKAENQRSHLVTLELIQYAHLDKLLADICDLKNTEPGPAQQVYEEVRKAVWLQKSWRSRLKLRYFEIETVRKAHLEKGGHLRGICLGKTDWTVDSNKKSKKSDAFYVGQWWLNIACAHRDRIVNSVSDKKATITPHKGCTIPLLVGREEVLHPYKTTYTLYSQPQSLFCSQLLSQSGKDVRILRGHELHSILAPEAGIRYDGMWKLSGLKMKLSKDPVNHWDESLDIHQLEFTLERVNKQKPMSEVVKIPTPSQMDDWLLYQMIEGDRVRQTEGLAQNWMWTKRDIQDGLERKSTKRAEINRANFDAEKTERQCAMSKEGKGLVDPQVRERLLAIQNAKNLKLQIPESAKGTKREEIKDVTEEDNK
ncbi:hypothetical protein QBC44DRAFT_155989 [Cladorrhinum sp. PSN332]|nr:hypothetical protein QBC44DRAFT_155989 [Cladorrhinum sp. PSN332]